MNRSGKDLHKRAALVAGLLVSSCMVRADEAAHPPWARRWDAIARAAYASRPDQDWDGLNDDEERTGLAVWGRSASGDAAWRGDAGASNLAEWAWCGIDDDVQRVSLPFAYPWGTQSWTHVWIGVNGTLGFDVGPSSPRARGLPDPALGPFPFFGVFWEQLYLDPGTGGRVWVRAPDPQRFVVCWENLQLSNAVNSRLTFQAELRGDGEMHWRYQTLDDGAGEQPGGVIGVQRGASGWSARTDAFTLPLSLRIAALRGVSPDNPDSDGDGIRDGIEFHYFTPDRADGRYLDPARADNPGDIDRDGLNVTDEYLHGCLDPFYWDSDEDGLGDGYEVATRMLANCGGGIHSPLGDADGDGLSNLEERLHRSQPRLADSDGDGTRDRIEVLLGSDPRAQDLAPDRNTRAPVRLRLGDPGTDSATEAYALRVEPVTGDTRGFTFQNIAYGVVETQTVDLVIGAHYRLHVDHLGSIRASEGEADPDYEAHVEGIDGTILEVDDPDGLLGQHLAAAPVPLGAEPLDTNRVATLWIQSRVLPDGTIPVADPQLMPRISAWNAGRTEPAAPLTAAECVSPGLLVLPKTAPYMDPDVLPALIRAHGLGVAAAGMSRWLRFSSPSWILVQSASMPTPTRPSGSEMMIDASLTADADFTLFVSSDWPAGATAQLDHLVKNSAGTIVAKQSVRLTRTVVLVPPPSASLLAWGAGQDAATPSIVQSQLSDPGVLILPAYGAAMGTVAPARLRFQGVTSASRLTRWIRFSDTTRVLCWREGLTQPLPPAGSEIRLTDAATANVEFSLRATGQWPIGTTVTVDYIIRNVAGEVVATTRARLLGQSLVAIGDSVTYGYRRLRNGTSEMPLWYRYWTDYPSQAEWGGYSGNWYDMAYQGWRGYLRSDLTTAVSWSGHPANGHGPDHCGYPGAWSSEVAVMVSDPDRAFPLNAVHAGPTALVVIYCIGLNDIAGNRDSATLYAYWKQGLDNILAQRAGRGRTLIIGVTLPAMRSDCVVYSPERQAQLATMNQRIRAHTVSAPFTRYVVADAEDVPHDSNDDGLHFLATGYAHIEQILRQALLNGLKVQP